MAHFHEQRVSTSDARENLSDILSKARFANTATVIEKHGRPVAAIVPVEFAERLQKIDDLIATGNYPELEALRNACREER